MAENLPRRVETAPPRVLQECTAADDAANGAPPLLGFEPADQGVRLVVRGGEHVVGFKGPPSVPRRPGVRCRQVHADRAAAS
jgi:hypothetical protein